MEPRLSIQNRARRKVSWIWNPWAWGNCSARAGVAASRSAVPTASSVNPTNLKSFVKFLLGDRRFISLSVMTWLIVLEINLFVPKFPRNKNQTHSICREKLKSSSELYPLHPLVNPMCHACWRILENIDFVGATLLLQALLHRRTVDFTRLRSVSLGVAVASKRANTNAFAGKRL